MDKQTTASISASSSTSAQTESAVSSTQIEAGLGDVRDLEQFLSELIERQCRMVDACAGIALLKPTREQSQGTTARCLPDPNAITLTARDYKRLTEIAVRAAQKNEAMSELLAASKGLLTDAPEYRVLAAPLRLMGRPHGASVCVIRDAPSADLSARLERLELSALMFESFLWRKQAFAEAQSKVQLRETLDLLDKSQQGHNVTEVASLFSHELQRRFGCTRVSIGLVHRHAIRLVALSGSEDVDRKSELAEALEAVMEECADQDTEIRYPQPDDADPSERRVVRAHTSLSERFGPTAIASFPLRIDGGLIGVAVMEREAQDPFNDHTLRLLRLVAEYLGPSIWTRRMADRGVLAVSRDRTLDLAQTVVGPEKTGAKLFALLCLVVILIGTVLPVRDRVVANCVINADQRRQVSPPFEGQISEVLVEPGDVVTRGQPMIKLDMRQIQFQLIQKRNELRKLMTDADDQRTQGKTAMAQMKDAEARGVEAEIRLLEYQLEQGTIRAPIDGVVTHGRLRDIIGEVVQPSEPLVEVAQLESLRAILLVNESGIARIKAGQIGSLALTSRPADKLEFEVTRITPASELYNQENVYRVDIELQENPDWLRPGMEGKARVKGDRSNLLMIYARPMIEAVRMKLWF
ncbi:MAG: HlyD family efflux transporter periplasmic adaptor subunit [Planctomycetes bacterium]|nr:HlyD family efflux transporter periplasmic adaptor subunit [Planctomycetota bacterium]NOG53273.1 HlyD family efflux transporter periplasmic adaptor subunit [Planctomycetota bacterium]